MTKDTIELFNAACAELGYDAATVLPDVSGMPEHHRKSATAYHMLIIIIEAAQKKANWKPDYHAENRKYFTWHLVKASKEQPAGFGFSVSYYDLAALFRLSAPGFAFLMQQQNVNMHRSWKNST